MRKILLVISFAFLFAFSCEKKTPFEEDRKINLEDIDWENLKRRLWCENDSIPLVFDNNTEH